MKFFTLLLLYFFTLAPPVFGAITYDTTTTSTCTLTCPTVVVVHAMGACANSILVVGTAWEVGGDLVSVIATGGALVSRGSTLDADGYHVIDLSSLTGVSGTQTVTATFSGTPQEASVTVSSYCGVNQATPHGTPATNVAYTDPATVDVTSATDELVVDTIFSHGTRTVGGGQTETANVATGESNHTLASSYKAGAATTTMNWTLGGEDYWGLVAIPLKPAATLSTIRHRPIIIQ